MAVAGTMRTAGSVTANDGKRICGRLAADAPLLARSAACALTPSKRWNARAPVRKAATWTPGTPVQNPSCLGSPGQKKIAGAYPSPAAPRCWPRTARLYTASLFHYGRRTPRPRRGMELSAQFRRLRMGQRSIDYLCRASAPTCARIRGCVLFGAVSIDCRAAAARAKIVAHVHHVGDPA